MAPVMVPGPSRRVPDPRFLYHLSLGLYSAGKNACIMRWSGRGGLCTRPICRNGWGVTPPSRSDADRGCAVYRRSTCVDRRRPGVLSAGKFVRAGQRADMCDFKASLGKPCAVLLQWDIGQSAQDHGIVAQPNGE